MGAINRSQSFMKQRVDILRPAFSVDPTTIRDKVLTSYVAIATNIRCYMEYVHSERVQNGQLGGIAVDRMVFFFPKNTNVKVNDVLKEGATSFNGNAVRYFDVVGVLPFSQYDFLVRVDADLKNYHRGT